MTHRPGSPNIDALAAYLEGTLEPPERALVEEHLARCGECRSTVAVFARARGVERRPARAASWLAAAAGLFVAAAVGVRVASTASRPSPPAAAPPERLPEVVAPPASSADPVRPAAPAEAATDPPSGETAGETGETRRSGAKIVGGKTFELVAGRWMDRDFDPTADLPAVTVSSEQERKALFARLPELAAYARLGDRVLVVHGGTVYRFEPPGP